MGAWGPGIFSDDTAADIRSGYRELLEDQLPDGVASQRVIEAYRGLDADEVHVLWLALAAAQSGLGRLDPDVKARALDVIDNGLGLERWAEAGPTELRKRQAALTRLRDKLIGPQPPRRVVRRPWRHETDLQPGALLALPLDRGQLALARVLRVDDDRVGRRTDHGMARLERDGDPRRLAPAPTEAAHPRCRWQRTDPTGDLSRCPKPEEGSGLERCGIHRCWPPAASPKRRGGTTVGVPRVGATRRSDAARVPLLDRPNRRLPLFTSVATRRATPGRPRL
jgi:hypothetical protein